MNVIGERDQAARRSGRRVPEVRAARRTEAAAGAARRSLISDVAPTIAPEAERRGIDDQDRSARRALPDINADPGMLRQALLNLAINACQAMPDGGTLGSCRPPSRRRVAIVGRGHRRRHPAGELCRASSTCTSLFTPRRKAAASACRWSTASSSCTTARSRCSRPRRHRVHAVLSAGDYPGACPAIRPADGSDAVRSPILTATDSRIAGEGARGWISRTTESGTRKIELTHVQPGGFSARRMPSCLGVRDRARRDAPMSVRPSRCRRYRRDRRAGARAGTWDHLSPSPICRRRSQPRRPRRPRPRAVRETSNREAEKAEPEPSNSLRVVDHRLTRRPRSGSAACSGPPRDGRPAAAERQFATRC